MKANISMKKLGAGKTVQLVYCLWWKYRTSVSLEPCESLNVVVHTCNPTLGRPGQRNSWGLQAGQPNQRGGQKKGNCLGLLTASPAPNWVKSLSQGDMVGNDRTGLAGLRWPLCIHRNVHLHTRGHIHYTSMHTHTQKKYCKISLTHFVSNNLQ